jgi:hypothetical protein
VARKRQPPVAEADRREIGGLLRRVRRAAGYRSVESAASVRGCPAARQTIYAYERGGLVPSLQQFLELVEFYATRPAEGAKTEEDLRAQAVAAIARAIAIDAYHFTDAMALMQRLQPTRPGRTRR